MLKNGCNIDGIMDDSVSYYTPLSAIYLIDIYYIRVNLEIKNKLQILNRDNKIKLLKIKIEIFDLLVLNGADTNLLGLNGKNLLGLEFGKTLSHINNKFISYIISKGKNPNYNNFVTNKEIPLSFDNNLLTEIQGNEFIIGLGYRFKALQIRSRLAGARQLIKSDLIMKADFSIRNNKTIVRYLDLDNNQVTSGQTILNFKYS